MADAWFRLPIDPTDEDLARGWTLSADDLEEVRRCRGDDNRRRFAIQLCALRTFGCFVDDVGRVPVRIANHVGRQVGLPPALFITDPERAATDTAHTQRIRAYLGYRPFDDDTLERLRATLEERAAAGVLAAELFEHARASLRAWKVEIPGRSTVERLVTASATRAASEAWELIANRLSPAFCASVEALLLKEEDGRSALSRFKQYPPEPNAQTILQYLRRAQTLREMGVGALDFSGVRPDVVVHLAELARRYDVDDLKRYAPTKRYAMAACFLAEAQKTALDHLVEMHHVFMTGLHRRAHHAFDARHKQLRQRSPRNLGVVLDAIEALLDPARPIADVARELDMPLVRQAIGVCRELQRVAEGGLIDELRARHHLLKRYLPDFLALPFATEPGSELLLAAIEHARTLHRGERAAVGADAPVAFAPPWLRRDIVVGGVIDSRLWETGLAFAVGDALRSGDLYLP